MKNKNVLRRKLNIVKHISCIIICFWLFLFPLVAEAEEPVEEETMQLIILLDGSQSMLKVDRQYLIKDFILEIAAIAPENCRIGAAVYQDELCFLLPPGSDYDEIEENLKKIEYTGYGNAGDGLERALALLQDENGERKILLVSDGEIMMRTEAQTAESVEAFAQAT
ncbi:MAG: VWA domain-containing protein, partial [Lachnospiraceae bacterium]|nr:VWA domain-containing protein [Lachnospiraceae bacterium]